MQQITLQKSNFPQGLEWIFTLPKSLQKELLQTSKIKDVETGYPIARESAHLTHLVAIISGRVNVYETDVLLGQSGAGASLGWLSVIDRQPLEFSLVAAAPCRLLLIPVELAMKLLMESKALMSGVLRDITASLRRYAAEKKILKVPNAYQRVYVHLLNIVQNNSQDKNLNKIPKQEEIARIVNTSRETVSRALQALVKQGVLHKKGHHIVVLDLVALQRAASHVSTVDSIAITERHQPS